ncbi:MAG TPA: DNA polymerase IV [Syntrophales bacterium]|nr:DNA polymerase IV [Syntrophales bacterium]
MTDIIFSLHSWPRAVLHIDADAFFTSCEEALHPELRGRPVVTGAERGIIACASYAAKGLGIKRGVPIGEAKRICPSLVVLPSDYETYSLFSRRMFAVMRRFSPQVEEYSIDEAFVDLTGLRRLHRCSYETLAGRIKGEIEREVGISVSAGLSLTKVLAKVGSRYRKPGGLTVIPGREIPSYLRDLPVEKVWGIGPATTALLNKMGVATALDFARLPEGLVRRRFTKRGAEIWRELRGEAVYEVSAEEKGSYASISKMKTFAPPTADGDYLFAHLTRNLESACLKARRYRLAAARLVAVLRRADFRDRAGEAVLDRPSNYPLELVEVLRGLFEGLYEKGSSYRATGVVLMDLRPDSPLQLSLFDDPPRVERVSLLYRALDEINGRYGKHTVHLASSHLLEVRGAGRRGEGTARQRTRFFGETARRHLGLPVLHLRGV